jgi:DNA-binding transcriptional LysR family regulator
MTQLNTFVLVARLRSVSAAARILGVSEPAVSRTLSGLRRQVGDPLLVRDAGGMTLTAGGHRFFALASQMVALGAEIADAVRAANGPAPLRLVVTDTIAEFVAGPLAEAIRRRAAGSVEVTSWVAATAEMPALLTSRLADVALGPRLRLQAGAGLTAEPVLSYQLLVVAGTRYRPRGAPSTWVWLVDPAGADPGSDVAALLRRLRVPERQVQVFPNQTAAWSAAADGAGVAPAANTLVGPQLRRRDLVPVEVPGGGFDARWHLTSLGDGQASTAVRTLKQYLRTPQAMQLLCAPQSGVPMARFRPPVHVGLWS